VKIGRTIIQSRPVAPWARLATLLLLAGGVVFFSGCSTVTARQNLDTIVALAPAPTLVTKGQELSAAETAAAPLAGAHAFVGVGNSMEPIYASGTALVVTPCAFQQLRRGMSVVYVNHNGQGVAHVLKGKIHDGWIAQGTNNPLEDQDLVTEANLVGVITQAYASADTPLRREIASRVAVRAAMLDVERARLALGNSKPGSVGTDLAAQ
jgi:hypothetical protein